MNKYRNKKSLKGHKNDSEGILWNWLFPHYKKAKLFQYVSKCFRYFKYKWDKSDK